MDNVHFEILSLSRDLEYIIYKLLDLRTKQYFNEEQIEIGTSYSKSAVQDFFERNLDEYDNFLMSIMEFSLPQTLSLPNIISIHRRRKSQISSWVL